MQKADPTTRAIAGFLDLLIVIALARLPDVLGFFAASGYILIRDGLFQGQSPGKKLIGLAVQTAEQQTPAAYRESVIRNVPFAAAYILFLIPYAGPVVCLAALIIEWLVGLGDERGMRIGDMLANTWVVQPKRETAITSHEPLSQSTDLSAETGVKQDQLP
jgi:uncharacterized RDD family membrane protein YckC